MSYIRHNKSYVRDNNMHALDVECACGSWITRVLKATANATVLSTCLVASLYTRKLYTDHACS